MYYPFLPGGLVVTGHDPITGMPIIGGAQPADSVGSAQTQTPSTGGAGGVQQTTGGAQQSTGGTQQGAPNIPAAPVFNSPWSVQQQPSFVRDAFGNVTPLQPSVTRDSAQQLANLLGGRLVNQADYWAGPFKRTDSWAVILPSGQLVDADAAAMLYSQAMREYEHARRNYELNRQLNPALFTSGPGFTMPPDPLTVLRSYQWDRAPSWITGESQIIDITRESPGTGAGGGTNVSTGPGTTTATPSTPSTTSSWYRFHRIDQPLGQWATRRENVMSPGLQQYGTSVFNAQSMGVPLGSPATIVERVTQTGPGAGAGAGAGGTGGPGAGTGGTGGTGGPGQVQMAPRFDQNRASLSDLWQASWSQYGGPSGQPQSGQSMTALGPASARPDSQHIETPSFLAPWGPARQNRPAYTVQYNPAGSLPF